MSQPDHSKFRYFRDKHKGEKCLLMAPGPSLEDIKLESFHGCVKVGVNGAIIHHQVRKSLDYYVWAGDIDHRKHRQPGYYSIFCSVAQLPDTTVTFMNTTTDGSRVHPIDQYYSQIHPNIATYFGAITFDQFYHNKHKEDIWYKNIEDGPLDSCSVIFQAMEIILHMGFSRIILAGCDCGGPHSYKSHVDGDSCDWGEQGYNIQLINRWKLFKTFMKKHFPEVQVTVLHPKGLMHIFPEEPIS